MIPKTRFEGNSSAILAFRGERVREQVTLA
jgi:hypothetical protein